MLDYLIYHTPGACSRVALNALEELGVPYRDKGVALMRGEHRTAAFLAINPKGKVPVLVEDGVVITELPAILYHLSNTNPNAALLPVGRRGVCELASLSDLIWIAGTLHPIAFRIFRPAAVSELDALAIRTAAIVELTEHAAAISSRLLHDRWWYGDQWSIVDVFVSWIFVTAAAHGFPLTSHCALVSHRQRVEARPAFDSARARERRAMQRDALQLPAGLSL